MTLPDAPTVIVPVISVFAVFVGVLGISTDVFGRRITSPRLRRFLPAGDLEPPPRRSLYATVWSVFFAFLGGGLLMTLLVSGIGWDRPGRAVAAVLGFVASAAVIVVIARGSEPAESR